MKSFFNEMPVFPEAEMPIDQESSIEEESLNTKEEWEDAIKKDPISRFLNSPNLPELENFSFEERMELLEKACFDFRVTTPDLFNYFSYFEDDLKEISALFSLNYANPRSQEETSFFVVVYPILVEKDFIDGERWRYYGRNMGFRYPSYKRTSESRNLACNQVLDNEKYSDVDEEISQFDHFEKLLSEIDSGVFLKTKK